MKRIFIFPTIEEAKAFILTEPRDPVFVGGVGMAEIAAGDPARRESQKAAVGGVGRHCRRL